MGDLNDEKKEEQELNETMNVSSTSDLEQKRTDAALKKEGKEEISQKTADMVPVAEEFSFNTFWNTRRVEFAVDRNGKRIDSREEIEKALSVPDENLFVHTRGGRVFVAKNVDGKLMTTQSVIPVRDGDMQVLRNRTAEMKTLLKWNEADISHGISASGKNLGGPEEIRNALAEGKERVFLYTVLDPDCPFAVEKRDEGYAISKFPQEVDLKWGDTKLLYARDVDGNEFRSPEAIQEALGKEPGRLLVHLQDDPDDPYMLEKREDGVYLSNDPVKSGNAMNKAAYRKLEGEPAIVPKKEPVPDDFIMSEEPLSQTGFLEWKKEDVLYAVGTDGKKITDYQKIVDSFNKGDTRMLLYTKLEEEPRLVERKKNRFYTSKRTMGKLEKMLENADPMNLDPELFTSEEEKLSAVKWNLTVLMAEKTSKILFAMDDDGRIYGQDDRKDEILSEMQKEGKRMFLFEQNKTTGQVTAQALENRKGKLYVSDAPINSRNKMKDTPDFSPKASIRVEDIINIADRHKLEELQDKLGANNQKRKALADNLENLNKVKDAKSVLKEPGKPTKPKKPGKPGLGFWGGLWRGITKFFTLGFGETKGYKKLAEKRKKYNEVELPEYEKKIHEFPNELKKYEAAMKKFREEEKALKYQKDHRKELEEKYRKLDRQAELEQANLKSAYNSENESWKKKSAANGPRQVKNYRDHLEVRVEGVADYMEKGEITPDNIFAYTWMKGAACKGKSASDPSARRDLAAYIASNSIQTKILSDKAYQTVDSEVQDKKRVHALNTGAAQKKIEQDEVFNKVLDDLKDGPIDPEKVHDRYLIMTTKKDRSKKMPDAILREAKEDLIRGFGKQPISDRSIDEVIRIKAMDENIEKISKMRLNPNAMTPEEVKRYESAGKKRLAEILMLKPTEAERKPYKDAAAKLGNQGPMKLDDMKNALESKMPKKQMEAVKNPEAGK